MPMVMRLYIPAYIVFEASFTYRVNKLSLKAGMNNITDKKYFTLRADQYPGIGIIPSIGGNFYIGVSATY